MQNSIQLLAIDSKYNSIQYRLHFDQLVLTLGYRCNLNCPSCFIGEKLNDHESVISYEDAIQAIESTAALQTVGSVAFVGGEPFLYYDLMLKIASYTWKHYQCQLNVSTNATWAKSIEQARVLIQPLLDRGLRWILVSLDEFHIKSGRLACVANCLSVCMEAGLEVSIQTLQHLKAIDTATFRNKLSEYLEVDSINWITNPVSAIGNAAVRIKREYMQWYDSIPEGGCSAGEILNLQPDGDIKPCCGAGLLSKRLSLGNIKHHSIYEMVKKAEVDPILNLLVSSQGPIGLAKLLEKRGYSQLVERHAPFTDACYACHAFLEDQEILDVLEEVSLPQRIEIFLQRIINLHGIDILQKVSQGHEAEKLCTQM